MADIAQGVRGDGNWASTSMTELEVYINDYVDQSGEAVEFATPDLFSTGQADKDHLFGLHKASERMSDWTLDLQLKAGLGLKMGLEEAQGMVKNRPRLDFVSGFLDFKWDIARSVAEMLKRKGISVGSDYYHV
ncbi:hypothetical protein BGX28_004091 [Mortierella sp. GBA30]|nr:hypothetical protein BGX28_004091 [Mortierella sp. GBA30]